MDIGREDAALAANALVLIRWLLARRRRADARGQCGIDHLDAAIPWLAFVQRLQHHAPPPPASSVGTTGKPSSTRRTGCADHAQSSLCGRSRRPGPAPTGDLEAAAPASDPSRPQTARRTPLLIRHQTTNQGCSPKRTALNQRSSDLEIHFVHAA